MKRDKVGLVLEGGGMRGIYTAGVLDVMLKNNLWVDGVIGVSAGALHGISYMSDQFGRDIRYYVRYRKDKRFMGFYSLAKTGDICDREFCYHEIPEKLAPFDYDTFKKNAEKIPCYAVCTNLETGKAEYKRLLDLKTNDIEYLRASASMPIVSNTVCVDGKKLLDGGTSDSIPVAAFRKMGYKKNIVVLTRPEGYEKGEDRLLNIMKRLYSDYPKYIEACRRRHIEYNKTIKYIEFLERKGEVLVIRPSRDMKVSRIEKNVDRLKYMYKLGWYDTKNRIEEIKKFML